MAGMIKPASPGAGAARWWPLPLPPPPAVTLPLVLIVDDNPENLTVIGELLQPGHVVRAANSGARALKLAGMDPRPDLILLDVMMPEMDGYEVLSQLRARSDTAEVPVIFLTALNSSADEERGLMLGAADYITKPIRPPILLARVRTQLALKQARDTARHRDNWVEAELARRLQPLQLVQEAGVLALASLAERHDPGITGHLQRTRAGVRLMARWLQRHGGQADMLGDAVIDALTRAVPLHDIGMHGLPPGLLQLERPYTDVERSLMRNHTVLGAQALGQALHDHAGGNLQLQLARMVVRSHHERWDGLGYPDGLAGDAIPMGARLLAVADSFDAMLTPRPWRPAHSPQQARDQVLAQRGRQFDPQVVDAFLGCFDAICAMWPGATPALADQGAA